MIHDQRGITLIETIVAASLVGLLLASIAGIYTVGLRQWAADSARRDGTHAVRMSMARIVDEVRGGRDVVVVTPSHFEFVDAENFLISYWMDEEEGALYTSVSGGDGSVLARELTLVSFEDRDGVLHIRIEGRELALKGAVVPRRSLLGR